MRYDEKAFIINGQRYFLTSGSVHYFRIPKELWWDRLTKAKQGGLNTIQTYVPWNYHEHREGQFDFEGERDLFAFLRLCQELGLFVILRPGPYICAEWEYGGFPVWFLEKQDLVPRHHSPVYLRYVKRWFDVLLPRVREHLITMGGPIIMVQIENELGNLIPDTESKPYMTALQQMCITNGIDVPLITCAGGLEGTLECINSHDPVSSFGEFRTKYPHAPLFSTEFWTQWYDVWGGPRPTTKTTEELVSRTWNILAQGGAGYNYYMWHGGTNFGYSTSYLQTTSYDYDAPLSETGRFTPKYHKTREIALYATVFSDILTTVYTGDADDYVSWKDKELEISVRRSDTGTLLFAHNTGAVPVNATMQQKKHGLEFSLALEPDEVWPLAFDSQLVAGVSDADLHLEFTTAKVLTQVENSTRSYLVLYGKGGGLTP